ncbi:MAG: hypothetical protein NTW73_00555 [Candidatus Parcubacteria bacterium]|nr:hypothetical protein [Candidatus Parcubacteria bacterium]
MGDYRQGGGGRGGGFGRRDGGRSGARDRGPVTMHQAVCDQCGKSCEVPFRPTEGKPVYCSACFGVRKDSENNRGGDRFPEKNFNSYRAPADTEGSVGKGNGDEIKQLEMLNVKMDRLIKAVEAMTNVKPLIVEEKVKKIVKPVPVVKIKKLVKKSK